MVTVMDIIDERTKNDPSLIDHEVLKQRLNEKGWVIVPFDHVDMYYSHTVCGTSGNPAAGVIGQRYGMIYIEAKGHYIWLESHLAPDSPAWVGIITGIIEAHGGLDDTVG